MSKIIVETSARHIHLSREHVETLFGAGYQLTSKKELSQPGQFACAEKVKVVGPKSELNMSILGPERASSQIEVSLTDARTLGVTAPIRESGDITGSAGVTLVGPCGEVTLDCGVIVAKRHIHITPADAAEMGVCDKQIVNVKVDGERATTFGEVVVRVSENFQKRMHIDTDEANGAAISGEVNGEIIK